MSVSGTWRRRVLIGAIGGVALLAGVVCATAPASGADGAALLRQAQTQACTTSLSEQCVSLLHRLEQMASQLEPEQRQRLHYLQAWQAAFGGNYQKSDALIDGIETAIVIDTGSDTSIGNAALASALARRHARETVQLVSVTGQQVTADLGLARTLTLGGLTLNNTTIAFIDAPPFERLGLRRRPALLLGMAQLRLFHRVAIDFAGRRILFAVPASPSGF